MGSRESKRRNLSGEEIEKKNLNGACTIAAIGRRRKENNDCGMQRNAGKKVSRETEVMPKINNSDSLKKESKNHRQLR